MLVGLRGEAHAVHEVQHAAVLLVPAPLDGHIENFHSLGPQVRVIAAVGLLQQEPGALDVMTGVDEAAGGDIGHELAVGTHGLQGAFQLRLVVILQNGVDAGLGALVVQLRTLRIAPAHDGGDVQIDHGVAQGAARAGLRDGLGTHAGGVLDQAVVELPDQVVGPAGPLQARLVAGEGVIFGVGLGVKVLGEAVPALAQGLAVGGDGEVHPVAGLPVDAVGLHEVQAALAGPEPVLPHAVHVAQVGVDPSAAALHPYAFIRREPHAGPVQAGVNAAVFRVHAVLEPKAGAALQLLLNPCADIPQLLHILHYKSLLLCILYQFGCLDSV